jgi:hypothetical protein
MKHASKSPWKKFIKYVIGYKGDKITYIPKNEKNILGNESRMASTGNSTDDFLTDKKEAKVATVAYCQDLMMPILSHTFDLDDSEMDQNLIDLTAYGHLTAAETKIIKNKYASSWDRIKIAFRVIDRKAKKAKQKKYTEKVSNKEFNIKKAGVNIKIAKKVAHQNVEGIANPKAEDVKLDKTSKDISVNIEKDSGMKVQQDKPKAKSLDIDNSTYIEPEFKGSNEMLFDFDAAERDALDVDGRGSFSV